MKIQCLTQDKLCLDTVANAHKLLSPCSNKKVETHMCPKEEAGAIIEKIENLPVKGSNDAVCITTYRGNTTNKKIQCTSPNKECEEEKEKLAKICNITKDKLKTSY